MLNACRALGLKGAAFRLSERLWRRPIDAQSLCRDPAAVCRRHRHGRAPADLRGRRPDARLRSRVRCRGGDVPSPGPAASRAGRHQYRLRYGAWSVDLLGRLEALLGRPSHRRVTGEAREGDIRHNRACLQRAEALLGFVPQVSLEDGLAEFIRWAESESGALTGFAERYAVALAEMRRHGLVE